MNYIDEASRLRHLPWKRIHIMPKPKVAILSTMTCIILLSEGILMIAKSAGRAGLYRDDNYSKQLNKSIIIK